MINMSFESFIGAINDGNWHRISELSDELGISLSILEQLSNVLVSFGLIKYDQNNCRIMIHPRWRCLSGEQPNIPKKVVADFIISPHSAINIESTNINNVSDIELEITLLFENGIRDITIGI